MPNPNPSENHEAFIKRCMSDGEANNSFPKVDQRFAFCSSQWQRRNKKDNPTPMKENFTKKTFNLKALDVDTHKKRVKIAIAELESIDRDNDIFDTAAFDKTIRDNGPTGTNEIWHLMDHTQKSFSALGKFSELSRDGKYVAGVSNYKDSFAWREVAWPLYESGDITQHSVGFETLLDQEPKSDGAPRIIKEVRLYEGSAVLWGANPNTPTMEVVKRLMNHDDDGDITAAEKIDEIIKKLKNQRRGYSEEDYSLLIVELKHLQKTFDSGRIADIFREPPIESTPDTTKTDEGKASTEPDTKSTQPETVECPKCKKITHNTMAKKNYIQCHRCSAVFVYGSKTFMDIF